MEQSKKCTQPKLPPERDFKIPCSWEVYGYATIRAMSLEEAIKKVCDDEFPLSEVKDPMYVDSSFLVDQQMAEEMNPEDLQAIAIEEIQ